MNFVFLTRCFKPTNLEAIKSRLKEVFHHTSHTYRHFIVVDMTRAESLEPFADFCDPNTTVVFSNEKPQADEYNTKAIDEVLAAYYTPRETFVYILDDDNTISKDFLRVCDYCEHNAGADALVFQIASRPELGQEFIRPGEAIGKIDWANFLTRLDVMKRLKIFTGTDSQTADGQFFNRMLEKGLCILYTNEELCFYNALPKP
jgi:hypothetical protein